MHFHSQKSTTFFITTALAFIGGWSARSCKTLNALQTKVVTQFHDPLKSCRLLEDGQAIAVAQLNGPNALIGATGFPLGTLLTLQGKLVIGRRGPLPDSGLEKRIRIVTVNGLPVKDSIELPLQSFDGLTIPEVGEDLLEFRGYERIEEIGYSANHWNLYGRILAERTKNGDDFEPAMTICPRQIRAYFLCLSISSITKNS